MKQPKMRELDLWIAEKVMGWRWFRFRMKKTETASNAGKGHDRWQQLIPPNDTWHLQAKYNAVHQPQGRGRYLEDETDLSDFRPTERGSDALEVLEKCFDKVGLIDAHRVKMKPYSFCIGATYVTDSEVEAETLPLAICLFAKKIFS